MKKLKVLNSLLLLSILGIGLTSCDSLDSNSFNQNSGTVSDSNSNSNSNSISNSNTNTNSNTTSNTNNTNSNSSGLDGDSNDDSFEITFSYDGYYKSLNGHLDSSLRATLTKLLVDTHKTKLSYDQVWGCLEDADESLTDSTKVECIYSSRLFSKSAHGSGGTSTWNREHVWAKSHGFPQEKYWAYTDCHHLHASECQINSSRSNSYFDNIPDATNEYYGNRWDSHAFEAADNKKGDIARSMFYMYARYNSSTAMSNGDYELTLDLTNDVNLIEKGNSNGHGYFGMLDTLILWHFCDKVDEKEVKRNEVVYNYQGDYNPFIDHPELVYYLFPEECKRLGIQEAGLKNLLKGSASLPGGDDDSNTGGSSSDSGNNSNSSTTIPSGTTYNFADTSLKKQQYLANQTVSVNNIDFNFSCVLNTGGSLRLGTNGKTINTVLDSKYLDSKHTSTSGDILTFSANVENITINISGKYGTVSQSYLMYSLDGGNTFSLLKDFGKIEGDTTLTASFNQMNAIYAFIINGSTPRVEITSIIMD